MDTLLQQMAGQAASCSSGASFTTPAPATGAPVTGQMVLLDMFFPGFSTFSAFVQKNLNIDLNLYIPLVLICGILTFAWQYFSTYVWDLIDSYMMSVVDVRTDDEIYNMLMGWVAAQKFAQGARRFVVNTNLNSRFWWLWRYDYEDEEEEDGSEDGSSHSSTKGGSKKVLAYTPTFGSHWFWYKGRLLCFRRSQSREMGFALPSEREEISIKCFGRNPWILKELLLEARQVYMKRDEAKTLIYRGTTKGSGSEPTWQRCMARTSRPFSTVILNEKVKKDLIDDVTDYLNPATRRWYANRGIPYRRGYLLHGPPGTGKSSLSLALAGFFKMRIYIVSLSSIAANEENLASLFSELPRRCVVLLEDIDTAGLTHTREGDKAPIVESGSDDMVPGQLTPGDGTGTTGAAQPSGRLSLSGLLNILDGVASQEGRVLIMTTNHIEKLDKALIRPGRVDMIVEFGRADKEMTAAIFRAIFAPLEGDEVDTPNTIPSSPTSTTKDLPSPEAAAAEKEAAIETQRLHNEATLRNVTELATRFAEKIPAHEFSPAEIQGFLLKHKRNAQAAVEGAEQWVVEARKEKVEKELKEAKEKREKEEKEAKEKAEKEAKEKEEKEKAEKADSKDKTDEEDKRDKKEKKKSKGKSKHHKRSSRKSRRYDSDSGSSSSSSSDSSSSSSDSESESEVEIIEKKSSKRKHSSKKKTKEPATPPSLVKEDTINIVVADEVPSVIAAMASPEVDENTEVAVEAIKGLDALPQISVTEVRSTGSEDGKDSGYGTP
ncbi:BCS1 N terminal-domain-containing protein [Sordaria brevicollis]|uniref:BCS1 N terminal-domain-containing protein n=1 Tax=Sordaria brevicollis TaxID=83679 RepID=A0AAE0UFA0_SORBR|nr:BCS1 N terminal-domain-containing protein [Sordaria brevicollis]